MRETERQRQRGREMEGERDEESTRGLLKCKKVWDKVGGGVEAGEVDRSQI